MGAGIICLADYVREPGVVDFSESGAPTLVKVDRTLRRGEVLFLERLRGGHGRLRARSDDEVLAGGGGSWGNEEDKGPAAGARQALRARADSRQAVPAGRASSSLPPSGNRDCWNRRARVWPKPHAPSLLRLCFSGYYREYNSSCLS